MNRTCKICLVEKDITKFVKNAPSRGGRLYNCYECNRSREQSDLRSVTWFDGQDIKALERDGYRCVKCGMTNEEHIAKWKRRITVDHIDGNGRYTPKDQRNNTLQNLQTLCLRCHGKKDRERRVVYPAHIDRSREKKYWYKISHWICPICGSEETIRERVHVESEAGHEEIEQYNYCLE